MPEPPFGSGGPAGNALIAYDNAPYFVPVGAAGVSILAVIKLGQMVAGFDCRLLKPSPCPISGPCVRLNALGGILTTPERTAFSGQIFGFHGEQVAALPPFLNHHLSIFSGSLKFFASVA
jgi:hypothetical protein